MCGSVWVQVLSRKGKAVALSQDHKPNDAVERARITNAGGFVTEAQNGHYRVNGNLNLSRSLGDLKYKGPSLPLPPFASPLFPAPLL